MIIDFYTTAAGAATPMKRSPESFLKHFVRCAVEQRAKEMAAERSRWFNSRHLPRVSVLARLPRHDRDALIAHFRAKEARTLADAMNEGDDYKARLARNRLEHVEGTARAFAELEQEGRIVA